VTVFVAQQTDALRLRKLQVHAVGLAHRDQQDLGQLAISNFPTLRFDKHRAIRVQPTQVPPQASLECLLTRLSMIGKAAEHRSAMGRQRLQIKHLSARSRQVAQQAAFSASGCAAQHAVAKLGRQRRQRLDHHAPESAVTAFQLVDPPTHPRHHVSDRCAALSAAPAVNQRPPGARPVREAAAQMHRDIARDQRRAEPARIERRAALVQGSDLGSLGVGQNRAMDRPG
jgi:hypothetical protein